MNQKKNLHLLVHDDNGGVRELIKIFGESESFSVSGSFDSLSFKKEYTQHAPDIIFFDLIVPNTNYKDLLNFLAKEACHAPIVVLSGDMEAHIEEAIETGNQLGLKMMPAIEKPIELARVRKLLEEVRSKNGDEEET